jgi:hypothetical protein
VRDWEGEGDVGEREMRAERVRDWEGERRADDAACQCDASKGKMGNSENFVVQNILSVESLNVLY